MVAPNPEPLPVQLYGVGQYGRAIKYREDTDTCVHGRRWERHEAPCAECLVFNQNILTPTFAPMEYIKARYDNNVSLACQLLTSIAGLDTASPQEARTPERFVQALKDLTTPEPFEFTVFALEEGELDEMIVERNIAFNSLCRHHVLPFSGVAHIAYIPKLRMAGISKLARSVRYHSAGLRTQEQLTVQIGRYLEEKLEPLGVAVVMEAEHTCFDDQTEILTENGWTYFKYLQPEQRVAQVDPATGVASFVSPLDYVEYNYTGPMLSGESLKTSTLVTPDHRVVFKSEWKHAQRPFQVKPAQEAWQYRTGLVLPRAATFANGAVREYDWARFLGIFMAEGSTHYSGNGSYHVVVSQNPGSTADAIKDLFDRLPYNYYIGRTPSGCLQFHITNKRLYDTLQQYKGSLDRLPPREVLNMSTQCIREFLRWHRMGDGDHETSSLANQEAHYTSSKALADFLQECLLRIGKTGNVRSWMSGGRQRYVVRPSDVTTTTLRESHRAVVDYSGYVYCVSVPTGAIMVRRNGTPLVSGNCMTLRGARSPGALTSTAYMGGVFGDHSRTAKSEFLNRINHG